MKKTLILVFSVLFAAVFLLLAFGAVKQNILHVVDGGRIWQHLSENAPAVNSPSSVSSDGRVDAAFSSHLPILLIDTDGSVISDLRHDESSSEASRYGDNLNPYTEMDLFI